MKVGDHIYTFNGIVFHHGIYIGNEQVIHFNGEVTDPINASIRLDHIDDFGGREIRVVRYAADIECFPPEEVVERAHARLNEKGYSLTKNNCEHFATWCKTGHHGSFQADTVGGGGFIASLVERAVYVSECSCGVRLNGFNSIWLCRSCGTRYCGQCIDELEANASTVSEVIDSMGEFFGIEGAGDPVAEVFGDRICTCGNVIDNSQRIRHGWS